MPAPDLIRGGTGFPKRSCSTNALETAAIGHDSRSPRDARPSHQQVSGENDEAAHGERGVDADQTSRTPPLAEVRHQDAAAGQSCQRNQCSADGTERGDPLIEPPGRSAQREDQDNETADAEKTMQRSERPRRSAPLRPPRCRTASVVPNSTAIARIMKAAISMTSTGLDGAMAQCIAPYVWRTKVERDRLRSTARACACETRRWPFRRSGQA